MNFSTNKEHRDFFQKNGWLECEELLSPNQMDSLPGEIKQALLSRIQNNKGLIDPDLCFTAGRDLWRCSSSLKKIILQKSFAEVLSELIDIKPLRIGYDQFFPSSAHSQGRYVKFLDQTLTLRELSGIQGVVGGLMICTAPSIDIPETPPFSSRLASGVFFSADFPINFSALKGLTQDYLLIVYAGAKAIYCRQDLDPNNNSFKQLDYNYGDLLLDSSHPIIYR